MQFNMCGNKCSGGPREKAAALVDSIVERGPGAVSLNEACRNQLTTVTRMLRKRHYPMNVRFKTTLKAASGACGGHDFGNAVLTRARIVEVNQKTFRAQTGADEKRAILCAKARMARTTWICSTHTVHDNTTIRARQIKQATNIVDGFRGPVVLMGDFNDVPLADSLDRLYAPKYGYGASGNFLEVDASYQGDQCRCGESTSGSRKIDYIFIKKSAFIQREGDATYASYSDHDPLYGRPQWR